MAQGGKIHQNDGHDETSRKLKVPSEEAPETKDVDIFAFASGHTTKLHNECAPNGQVTQC